MRQWIVGLLLALAMIACGTYAIQLGTSSHNLGTVVLHAQQMPIVKTLAWDANPVSDAVLNYVVRQNGVIVGSPTGVTQSVTFPTWGVYTLTVVAVNLWAESTPSTLVVDVRMPGTPKGMGIK